MRERTESQAQVKNIFVDLDETLIHTNLGETPNEVPEVTVIIDKEPYTVSLRPGANDLLFKLREAGHVFMLTRATHDYAVAMNKQFNLGFAENRIYSRKDVHSFRYKELHLPKGKIYLIDDLHQTDNYEKVALISQLGRVKYINIKPFYGFKEEALTPSYIESIVSLVKKIGRAHV